MKIHPEKINSQNFDQHTLDVFKYQAASNPVYHQYLKLMSIDPVSVEKINQIPFLPIEFFKTHKIVTGNHPVQKVFESSGTTGQQPSKHYISDLELYEQSFLHGFENFFGTISKYCILALLPSYLERQHSSLVYMVEHLIKDSHHPESGFFLNDLENLSNKLKALQARPTILLGVSFALLDLAEKYPQPLGNTIVMETGGMKGRREELTREALHETLKKAFGVEKIYSEYGMTELQSQAYSKGDGVFETPPWMKVMIRDQYDPMSFLDINQSGGINIIDLANVNSCSFIATQDLGQLLEGGKFTVLGRMDNAEIRGCNLLLEN